MVALGSSSASFSACNHGAGAEGMMWGLFLTEERENRGKGLTHYDFLYKRLLITNPVRYHFITADYLVSCQEEHAGGMET